MLPAGDRRRRAQSKRVPRGCPSSSTRAALCVTMRSRSSITKTASRFCWMRLLNRSTSTSKCTATGSGLCVQQFAKAVATLPDEALHGCVPWHSGGTAHSDRFGCTCGNACCDDGQPQEAGFGGRGRMPYGRCSSPGFALSPSSSQLRNEHTWVPGCGKKREFSGRMPVPGCCSVCGQIRQRLHFESTT